MATLQTPTAAWPLKPPPKCPGFDPPFILPFYDPRSNFFNRLNVGNCGERNTRILWHGKKPVDLSVTFRLWNVLQYRAHIFNLFNFSSSNSKALNYCIYKRKDMVMWIVSTFFLIVLFWQPFLFPYWEKNTLPSLLSQTANTCWVLLWVIWREGK